MSVFSNQKGITRSTVILGIFAILAIFVFLSGIYFNNDGGVGTGEEYSDPNGPSIMNNSEELYRIMNNDVQFTSLRENLTYFAINTLEGYKSGSLGQPIFTVSSKVSKSGGSVNFSGTYKNVKDTITVRVDQLKSNKIKISVTNKKNGTNIDTELPSNSRKNQFTGSLPFSNDLFLVEYNSSVDSYTITALSSGAGIKQNATNYIIEGTGLSREQLKILYKPYLD